MSRETAATFLGRFARLFVLVAVTFVLINSRSRDNFPVSYKAGM